MICRVHDAGWAFHSTGGDQEGYRLYSHKELGIRLLSLWFVVCGGRTASHPPTTTRSSSYYSMHQSKTVSHQYMPSSWGPSITWVGRFSTEPSSRTRPRRMWVARIYPCLPRRSGRVLPLRGEGKTDDRAKLAPRQRRPQNWLFSLTATKSIVRHVMEKARTADQAQAVFPRGRNACAMDMADADKNSVSQANYCTTRSSDKPKRKCRRS
ncbi:hypothetical protein F5Y17DRAFT_208761 [Xylariaceae sp. FL0594]|nr:hypothetical protein F5Y17DRAFT_208761 [Xylariaceae sp. FL0594]